MWAKQPGRCPTPGWGSTGRDLPRPGAEIPPAVTALVAEVMARRDYQTVDGDPWRVRVGVPFAFRDETRVLRFIDRSRDPNVEFFVQRSPGFLKGEWLVVYVPFDLPGLARCAARLGHRGLSRWRQRR